MRQLGIRTATDLLALFPVEEVDRSRSDETDATETALDSLAQLDLDATTIRDLARDPATDRALEPVLNWMKGANHSTTMPSNSTATMLSFDPKRNTWRKCKSMPLGPRGLFSLVPAEGFLYAIGGLTELDNFTQPQGTVERYDPKSDSWRTMATMNRARGNCGVAAFAASRHVLAVGGVSFDDNGNRIFLTSSEIYDVRNDEWHVVDEQLSENRVRLVCALEDRNTVLAIGGAVVRDGIRVTVDRVEAIHIRASDDDVSGDA